jgi:hypothetical protein
MKKGYYTNANRAFAFNETNVKEWFNQYKQLLSDLGITSADQVWNADEVCLLHQEHRPLTSLSQSLSISALPRFFCLVVHILLL